MGGGGSWRSRAAIGAACGGAPTHEPPNPPPNPHPLAVFLDDLLDAKTRDPQGGPHPGAAGTIVPSRVRLLKISAEGWDARALHGARRLLSLGRVPYVHLVFNADHILSRNCDPRALILALFEAGYRMYHGSVFIYREKVRGGGWGRGKGGGSEPRTRQVSLCSVSPHAAQHSYPHPHVPTPIHRSSTPSWLAWAWSPAAAKARRARRHAPWRSSSSGMMRPLSRGRARECLIERAPSERSVFLFPLPIPHRDRFPWRRFPTAI